MDDQQHHLALRENLKTFPPKGSLDTNCCFFTYFCFLWSTQVAALMSPWSVSFVWIVEISSFRRDQRLVSCDFSVNVPRLLPYNRNERYIQMIISGLWNSTFKISNISHSYIWCLSERLLSVSVGEVLLSELRDDWKLASWGVGTCCKRLFWGQNSLHWCAVTRENLGGWAQKPKSVSVLDFEKSCRLWHLSAHLLLLEHFKVASLC